MIRDCVHIHSIYCFITKFNKPLNDVITMALRHQITRLCRPSQNRHHIFSYIRLELKINLNAPKFFFKFMPVIFTFYKQN